MSDQWSDPPPAHNRGGGDWWSRRPRRSTTDRKVAGVAGGLGRTFNVDPVVIRIGFVVLTIFGGIGSVLYLLGWLLLPADGDEVSAGEALIGRGRSSTPPVVAVGVAIFALMAVASTFRWGLPFWPLIVGGVIAIMVAKKHGANGCGSGRGPHGRGRPGPYWAAGGPWSQGPGSQGPGWQGQAQGPSSQGQPPRSPESPFDTPPFWESAADEQPKTSSSPTGSTAAGTPAGSGSDADSPAADSPDAATVTDPPAPRTPPAWDPLGVAPFAWDLPEPSAAPQPAEPRRRSVVGRVTTGIAFLLAGLATVGVFAGWWALSWAQIAASALAVVAIGLLIGSLRGRGHSLIGPGVFLALVTLALTITGIDGNEPYGSQEWRPASVNAMQPRYVMNGGEGVLDLSDIEVAAGESVRAELEVRAGHAEVIVPEGTTVNATCVGNVGQVDCLGQIDGGIDNRQTATQAGDEESGTIDLLVRVGAGQAEVRNG